MKTNVKDQLKTAIASRNYTQEAVAKLAGWSSQSSLSMAINRDNPSIETVMRVLDVLGYDLVIKDRHSANTYKIEKVGE